MRLPCHDSAVLLPGNGVVADKPIRFVHVADEGQSAFQRGVLVADVVAEVDEFLFDATGVKRMHSRHFQPVGFAVAHQPVESVTRLIHRQVDFPAQFADIGNAMGAADG